MSLEKVLYISGDDRSGSTLLDRLLGNHLKITSLGELHHLNAYANLDTYTYNPRNGLVCMCGEKVFNCYFWKDISRKIGKHLSYIKLVDKVFYKQPSLTPKYKIFENKLKRKILNAFPYLLKSKFIYNYLNYPSICKNLYLIYEAVSDIEGTPFVVDSSKHPQRFLYLYRYNPMKIKVILINRDPRGVIYSKIKRGWSLVDAAKFWTLRSKQMNCFSQVLPIDIVYRIKYENICHNTEFEMENICKFIKIPFEKSICFLKKERRHHIGGSPSKFSSIAQNISIDESYKNKFSSKQIDIIRKITKEYRREWDYNF